VIWQPLRYPVAVQALARELARWLRTPYAEGQGVPGRDGGTDCVRFVGGVLDSVRGRPRTPVRALRRGAAQHDHAAAAALMADLVELFVPMTAVRDGTYEPGDVVVLGLGGGGPQHLLLAGPARWSLWEAGPSGVLPSSAARLTAPGVAVLRVWRPEDKGAWR
jgi:hypothetical protein